MGRSGLALGAVCVVLACGCKTRRVPVPQAEPGGAAASGTSDPIAREPARGQPPGEPEGEIASEIEARVLLAERFRARGLRVRYDVRVREPGLFDLTVDGYDPESRVGFEYIAAAERGTDVAADERAALAGHAGHRILILDATRRSEIARAAERFLGSLAARAR